MFDLLCIKRGIKDNRKYETVECKLRKERKGKEKKVKGSELLIIRFVRFINQPLLIHICMLTSRANIIKTNSINYYINFINYYIKLLQIKERCRRQARRRKSKIIIIKLGREIKERKALILIWIFQIKESKWKRK